MKYEGNHLAIFVAKLHKAMSFMVFVPGPHLRHLVSHLAQGLGRAQDIPALLPSTQFTNFPSFIEDLADGLLACVP